MTERTLRQRIIGGIGAQAFMQIVQAVVRLAEVPAFLLLWSATQYGEWLVVSAIPSYLVLADGGFATTAGREMTMRLSDGDQDGAVRVFQSSLALLAGIAVIGILLIAGLLFASPLVQWIAPAGYGSLDVKIALLLLSGYVLAGFFSGLLYGVYAAVHRYDLGTWIGAWFLFLDLLFSLIGAGIGGSLSFAAGGLLFSRFLLIGVNWVSLRGLAPWCRLGFSHVSRDVIKALAAPAAGSMALPLGMAANISGMRILVAAVLGPAAVPLFSSMRTLARLAQMPMLFIIRILEPELAIAYGQKRLDTFRVLFRRSCQIALWSGLIMSLAALAGAELFFSTWVHGRFALDLPTFLLLLAASSVNGLWYTALQAAYATNRIQVIAIPFALIYGVACLLLGWESMLTIGLAGAAFALVVVELAMCAVTLPQMLRLSRERRGAFFRTVSTPPVIDLVRIIRSRRASIPRSA